MKYTFYKEDNDWFIHLPEWEGSKADLQMVGGADRMLDILSGFTDKITLEVSREDILKASFSLKLIDTLQTNGATYECDTFNFDIWLCDVTKWLFGEFPEIIYFKVIK